LVSWWAVHLWFAQLWIIILIHLMMVKPLCTFLSLSLWLSSSAQFDWFRAFDPSEGSSVNYIWTDDAGRPFVILTEAGPPYSTVIELSADGAPVHEGSFPWGAEIPYGTSILRHTQEGHLMVLGSLIPEPLGPADSTRVALFRYNEQLEPLQFSTVGIPAKRVAYMASAIAPDNTIRVAYQTFVDSSQPQQFRGLTMDMEGNEIQSVTLLDIGAFPSIGSLGILPNGNMLMTTTAAIWDLNTLTTGIMQQYDDSWGLLHTHGLPMVDPSTAIAQNGPNWPLYTHVLPSGNVIASGHYWKCFCDDRGVVLQRATVAGEVLAQWTADSPYLQELPAWIKAVDVGPNGDLYYAQMNNWGGEGVAGTVPSQVELFRMDTALNVLGRYLFDGFETNTYYFPSFVKATPDGGLLVGGSMVDLNEPGAQPQGWVAKFGPEGFVGIGERADHMMLLFPNPGDRGFNLSLAAPIANGQVDLHDMQGRLVQSELFSGINGFVATQSLASGLYAVTLRDAQGNVLYQQRWAKE